MNAPRRISNALRSALLVAVLALGLVVVPGPPSYATGIDTAELALAAYNRMNLEREVNRLPGLPRAPQLMLSAYRHSLSMAQTDTMSHQVPGEASLGARLSAAGYPWRAAGENIGWSTAINPTAAVNLEKMMYYETAPNNGHRLNILNPIWRHVGVAVVVDTVHNRMWLTMDFGTTG